MADIALKDSVTSTQTGNNTQSLGVEESLEQMTLRLSVDMNAGTPVFVDSDGEWAKADASAAGTAKFYGILVKNGKAGQYRTAIAKGIVDGFDFDSQSYGAAVYLSDTEGALADAAGTVSFKIGEIIPVDLKPLGSAADKLLRIKY